MAASDTLVLLPLAFCAGAAYALAARRELAPVQRVLLSASFAAPGLLLAFLWADGAPASDATPWRQVAWAAGAGLAGLAMRGPLGALGASVLLVPAVLLPSEAARAGPFFLAGAAALLLLLPGRERWERAAARAFVPAAVGVALIELLAGVSPVGLGVAALALASLAGAWLPAARRTLPARLLVTTLLVVVLATFASPALGRALAMGSAPVLALAAFLRLRAWGALTRPLAAGALGYAASVALRAAGVDAPALLAIVVVMVTLLFVEASVPALDEDRARRRLLATPRETLRQPTPRDAPGALLLGRYRLERLLGEGGFGRTWLSEDETTGRAVAVKVHRGSAPHPRTFLSEARAMAAIRHPHVVRVLDVQTSEVGDVLVMEHVDGGTLADRLARGGMLPPAEARRLAEDVFSALAAVHDAGLVHRDVKPSNVLLTREGLAKLGDFGIARDLSADATLATAPLAPPAGTIRYLAPEQARGRAASAASDVFSAAATLFEALTGLAYVPPREGESAIETQLRVAALGPFARTEVDDPAFRAWFSRALDPDPSMRFASGREAREALLGALSAPAAG